MIALRPGQRIATIPGYGMTVHTGRATLTAGGANPYAAYFDHLWIAKGAASLAASYTDQVGAQTLTVGAAPTLGANGWVFAGAEYLDTGIGVNATYGVMVRCVTWSGFSSRAFSAQVVANSQLYYVQPQQAGGSIVWRNNGITSEATGTVADTIFTIAGLTPYRGTTAKTAMSGITGTTQSLYIGANHTAYLGADTYFTGTIAAFGMRAAGWNAAEQAAAHALLAAL